jgi:hypothetical protein
MGGCQENMQLMEYHGITWGNNSRAGMGSETEVTEAGNTPKHPLPAKFRLRTLEIRTVI